MLFFLFFCSCISEFELVKNFTADYSAIAVFDDVVAVAVIVTVVVVIYVDWLLQKSAFFSKFLLISRASYMSYM